MNRVNLGIMGLAALLLAEVSPLGSYPVMAEGLEYQFNHAFSGATPASTNLPWVDAVFQDVAPGRVQLTVTNLNLVGGENVDQLYFNLNPNHDASSLVFSAAGGSGGYDAPAISLGVNTFKADGDGKYDILFNFSIGGSEANRFTANESLVYEISGIPGLTAADFGCLSQPAGGAGPFYAAAHVQRIGAGLVSGWVSATDAMSFPLVPEPQPTALLGFGAAAWFVLKGIFRRRPD